MGKDSMGKSRRSFLLKTMSVVPALTLGNMAANAISGHAPQAVAAGSATAKAQAPRCYEPRFFNPDEFKFIEAAVSRLIPKDNLGPGAFEAGVPEFIDRQMLTPYGVATIGICKGLFTLMQTLLLVISCL